MTIQRPNAVQMRTLTTGLMRLYFLSLGHELKEIYARGGTSAEADEDLILAVLESARNVWRIRRSRSERELVPLKETLDDTMESLEPTDF